MKNKWLNHSGTFFALVMLFCLVWTGCRQSAEKKLEGPGTTSKWVVISGPASEVQNLQIKFSKLRKWSIKGEKCVNDLRDSIAAGDPTEKEICFTKTQAWCRQILRMCEGMKVNDKQMSVNGALGLVRDYERFADTTLENLGQLQSQYEDLLASANHPHGER